MPAAVSRTVTLEYPATGGHVGFAGMGERFLRNDLRVQPHALVEGRGEEAGRDRRGAEEHGLSFGWGSGDRHCNRAASGRW